MTKKIMDIRKIKALMVENGVTNAKIAREKRVSRTWVSLVLNGHQKSKRIRQAIAEAVGMNVEDLWPNGDNKAA